MCLTEQSSKAATFEGERAAFAALIDACALYPETAFRLCSGATVSSYRVQAFHIHGGPTRWIAEI